MIEKVNWRFKNERCSEWIRINREREREIEEEKRFFFVEFEI